MEACLIIGGVLMTAGVVAVLLLILKPLSMNGRPRSEPARQPGRPRNWFEFCPACDAPLVPSDRDCPDCGLGLDSRKAGRLERLRVARVEIRHLRDDGRLDAETADRVAEELARRRRELMQPEERPAPAPAEVRRARPRPLPTSAPESREPEVAAPTTAPQTPPEVATPSAPPGRPLAEVLGQYMHERNILWGELAGGLLIVGCSIALVLSLWQTLEALPYFTFLLLAAITGAVFGAGVYTLHHWKLTATSRGLLVIALLLTPLNLLLLADPGARGTTTAVDTAVKLLAVVAFAGLVRTGGRDLVGTDELPGSIPRRWLLALAVVGPPASLMVPAGSLAWLSPWLPLACFGIASALAVGRLSREQRSSGAAPLGERAAAAVMMFVGLGLFALFVAWGFVVARSSDLPAILRNLAVPTVLAGLPVLSAGLLVHRRLAEPMGLRATGTGVAVAGMLVLVASLVLAWPDPSILLATAAAVATVLGWVGFRDEAVWAYALAVPCAAVAVVLGYHGLTAGFGFPEGTNAGRWLAERLAAAESGAVLVGLALVLGVASDVWARRGRMGDALGYAIGAAGVAVIGLFLVTLHGVERPALAACAHVAAALGFVASSFRWRLRVVAQFGVWLLLLATLWSLWATIPSDRAGWGLVVAIESLVLAVGAVGLRAGGVGRLGNACRDVAAAAAILAPLLGVAELPGGAVHSATLTLIAASVFVLTWLYREPVLAWVGSLAGLVALGHLTVFSLPLEPWHGALLAALLAHATLASTAALRPSALYAGPLRLSGRLTACLALPLLVVPAAGLAGAWVGLALWAGGLWLIAALAWRERGTFSLFQLVYTWAGVLVGFAWVERQPWYGTGSLGVVDPRAIQAYAVPVGTLSIAWAVVRRALRSVTDVRSRWSELRPSVDQAVLGALVVGNLILAVVGVVPLVVAELAPAGTTPAFIPVAEAAHLWSSGAWLVLGVLAVAVLAHLRWPAGEGSSAIGPVVGLTVLALTVPVVLAGGFAPQTAAASALRWGMAAVFLGGSTLLAVRESVAGFMARAGFPTRLTSPGLRTVRALVTSAAGVVIVLTIPVAWLGLMGQAPSGPAADSVFGRMGWTASVILPLAAVVVGLAGTALRERSAGYAFAGGWVWTATIAGGYALAVVTAGGSLDAAEQMRIALLAVGGVSVWALAWLGVERRVPGRGLLTIQAVIGLAGMATLAAIPLALLLVFAGRPLGPASARLGHEGALALIPAALAALWHAQRATPAWRIHVIGLTAVLSGVLAACAVTPWDGPEQWLSLHVLAAYWAVCGIGLVMWLWRSAAPETVVRDRVWIEVLAVALLVLGLRGGWDDPSRPTAPASTVLFAGALIGAVALRIRSRGHEYMSGLLAAVAAGLVWVAWGPTTASSLGLSVASGLALAGAVWTGLAYRWRGSVSEPGEGRPPKEEPGDDLLGLPAHHAHWLPPFPHFAASAALLIVLFALLPTLAGANVDPPGLAWGAVAAVGLVLVALLRDRDARFAAGGLYALGAAAVCLGVAHLWPGPVWLDWRTPVALAGYVLAVSAFAGLRRAPDDVRPWLLVGQAIVAGLILAMGVRTAIDEPDLGRRLIGPLSVLLLVPAAVVLARRAPGLGMGALRPAALGLGAAAVGLLAWAIPEASWPVPWLHRHGLLFAALSAAAAVYSFARAPNAWADDFRRIGGAVAALAVAVLVVFLIQQIPHFNPDRAVRKTPLMPGTVFTVVAAIIGLVVLAIRTALRPDRDPLGPTAQGRAGYVYLAELLLVLLFVHVRLNVPQVFVAEAVKFWTFIVMLLAFVGVGLAELFSRRGLPVLARPLRRTGVLLPLIPLLAFWAKPPALVTEFAETRAPGLQPMLGYLKNLPQHFDTYAVLWFLAGLLYGLIALSRRSFGWALLGALATNAGLWALLSHHQVPAAVHPQAWAIPLALIILVSEHVNRDRLRHEVAAGLRYLGISMIYVSSAADLFIAGVGQSLWLPVVLAVFCLTGVVAGVLLRVRAFLYLGIGFLLLDVFSMIWHAAVDRHQTWVWYASGIVLGAIILALFAVLEKRRNDVRELVGRLREWNA